MAVRMIVPPGPVLALFFFAGLRPIVIMHVLVFQKLVIRVIFVVIPLMPVLMVFVVIPLLTMVVVIVILRLSRDGHQKRGTEKQYA